MSCSCDVALILLALLFPRASGFLPGLAIAACILALLIPLRLWWFQSCRVALPRKYFLRMSKAQRRRVHQKHLRALWIKDRRERQRLQRVLWKMSRGFCASTNGASPVDTRRGCAQDINAVQKTSACKTVYPADEINALHVSATNALSTFPDSCGQGVATPCLVHGGCRDHQLFWSFQHQQSGGRRTFQHLHDPAWQVVGAQDDEAPDIHGNGAAETSATSSGSSVNITGDADAIIISGPSQASAQQARDAFKATFGGVICCDSFEHKSRTAPRFGTIQILKISILRVAARSTGATPLANHQVPTKHHQQTLTCHSFQSVLAKWSTGQRDLVYREFQLSKLHS